MFYHLFYPLRLAFNVLNVFGYITFRAAGAAVTAFILSFILGPIILRQLRAKAIHQVVREGTPESHQYKSATPTMGGLIFLSCAIVSVLLLKRLNLVQR